MADSTQANWNAVIIVYGSKVLIKIGNKYWKQLENKQEMKRKNCINKQEITNVVCFKCYNHKTMACNY